MTCALCRYYEAQYHRALADALELRLQVADGPRVRVRELEVALERANSRIASLNAEIAKGKT